MRVKQDFWHSQCVENQGLFKCSVVPSLVLPFQQEGTRTSKVWKVHSPRKWDSWVSIPVLSLFVLASLRVVDERHTPEDYHWPQMPSCMRDTQMHAHTPSRTHEEMSEIFRCNASAPMWKAPKWPRNPHCHLSHFTGCFVKKTIEHNWYFSFQIQEFSLFVDIICLFSGMKVE